MTTIINGSSPSITFSDGSAQTSATRPFLNRIINGAMVIDQRNAGASVTPATGTYTLDRWRAYSNNSTAFTVQQSSTAPVGFVNSMLITSTAATSVGASDYYFLQQRIEGFNTADLNWGTANAKTITISFWVRSSLTGTFGGALGNNANNRAYPFAYTISSANTYEYKTVTIAGDTTGTWATDNNTGISLVFDIGSGANNIGTAGSWSANNYYGATGDTKLVATNGATFYITGVQLEVGSTATSFDYRSIGTELALCQRYYWKGGLKSVSAVASGKCNSTSDANFYVAYPVPMRATPTLTQNTLVIDYANTTATFGSSSLYASTTSALYNTQTVTGSPLTAGQGVVLRCSADTSYIDFTAEL
jgi:hypothetical protein